MTTEPRAATAADAKAVWDSFEKAGKKPSVRGVAAALNASGQFLKTPYKRVHRWKDRNWDDTDHRRRKNVKTPLEQEIAAIDAALPALTGDPTKRLADFTKDEPTPGTEESGEQSGGAPKSDEPLTVAKLKELPDDQLLAQAERTTLHGIILVGEEVKKQAGHALEQPGEFGGLLKALAGSYYQVVKGVGERQTVVTNMMKTIDSPREDVDDFEDVMAAIRAQTHANAA